VTLDQDELDRALVAHTKKKLVIKHQTTRRDTSCARGSPRLALPSMAPRRVTANNSGMGGCRSLSAITSLHGGALAVRACVRTSASVQILSSSLPHLPYLPSNAKFDWASACSPAAGRISRRASTGKPLSLGDMARLATAAGVGVLAALALLLSVVPAARAADCGLLLNCSACTNVKFNKDSFKVVPTQHCHGHSHSLLSSTATATATHAPCIPQPL